MTKQKSISQKLAEKTFKELGLNPNTGKPIKSSLRDNKRKLGENKGTSHLNSPNSSYPSPKPPFRIKALEKTKRQSPKGLAYQHSALYRNAVVLQLLVKKFTSGLNPKKYHRLIDQMDSSARSVVANIREGYLRPTSAEYSIFLGYSQGSLEEIRGDIIDAKDDELITSRPGSTLAGLGIELKPHQSPNKSNLRDNKRKIGEIKGTSHSTSPKSSYPSPKVHLEKLKRKIRDVKRSDLTYETFIELINKTDWLLKKAVKGIDEKIINDEKLKLKEKLDNHWRKYW